MLYLSAIVLLGFTAILIIIAYWMLFIPRDIITFNRQPYRILTPVVKAGSRVVYEADIYKYVEATSTTQRSFVCDGVVYAVPPVATNLKAGPSRNRTPVSVPVPDTIPPGKCYLTIGLSYNVNALRQDVTYHASTEAFMVEK